MSTTPRTTVTTVAVTTAAVLVAAGAGVLLGVLCAFLVPLRINGLRVPACFLLAAGGAVGTVRFAHRATGSIAAAAAPTLAWFVTMMALAARTTEGDLVVPGNWVGLGVLLVGSLSFAVAAFLEITERTRRRVPGETDRAETVTRPAARGTM